jgi:DNA modification methylase
MLPTETDPARIVCGDCVALLDSLPAGCASLVFADPPFNIGYTYDVYDDARERADYLAWSNRWVLACCRVLAPTGSLFLAIGDEYAAEYKLILQSAGLHFRNWIIWHYRFGPHQQKKFGRDHAHILYFTRDPERFTFNPDAVKVPSVRQQLGDKRAKAGGRVPGDVWQFEACDVWSVPRLPGNAKERTGHPCQMPESIITRIILAASNAGELVVDPFCGSGTTVAVAKRLGRRCLTAELSEDYAARAAERAGVPVSIQGA